MSVIERFHLAFGSHLGTVFLALLAVLAGLFSVYWWLVIRQKRRDLLAYLYRAYYEKAEALLKNYTFTGAHKAEFFGRQTAVKDVDGQCASCLVPPPDLAELSVREGYRRFMRAMATSHPVHLCPTTVMDDQEALAIIQEGLYTRDGKALPNLRQYIFDKHLGPTDREEILLELAKCLAQLHELRSEEGEPLFHGLLLPRYIFIELDPHKRVSKLQVAHAGFVYAMGSSACADRLKRLREGKLPIERRSAHDLLEQVVMLAPEQRQETPPEELGPEVDFFAFGALAVSLLTQKRFVSAERVSWNQLPDSWRPFIQQCLESDPADRPKDFMELQDWLEDPELALTHSTASSSESSGDQDADMQNSERDATTLIDLLDRVQSKDDGSTASDETLAAGVKAVRGGRWKAACQILEKLVKEEPNNAEAAMSLAIAHYERGEMKRAEKYYVQAKQLDPKLAKRFRRHIAFRL